MPAKEKPQKFLAIGFDVELEEGLASFFAQQGLEPLFVKTEDLATLTKLSQGSQLPPEKLVILVNEAWVKLPTLLKLLQELPAASQAVIAITRDSDVLNKPLLTSPKITVHIAPWPVQVSQWSEIAKQVADYLG